MAIVLAQEKKPFPFGTVLAVVTLAGIALFAVYYLFLSKPEVVDIVIPSSTRQISEIARTSFNPEELLQSPAFTKLKSYTSAPAVPEGSIGKVNPFVP